MAALSLDIFSFFIGGFVEISRRNILKSNPFKLKADIFLPGKKLGVGGMGGIGDQGGRGHCVVYYTSAQSFITKFSYWFT